MTYLIVIGVWIGAGAVVSGLFFFVFLPVSERRAAARAQFQIDPHEAAVRDIKWHATGDPATCLHDDVLEDWNRALETWERNFASMPPGVILDQGGVCRKCGARVVRHGSPYAWSEWMLDAASSDDDDAGAASSDTKT